VVLNDNLVNTPPCDGDKIDYLDKSAADQGVWGHKPAIPIDRVPSKPLDSRTRVFDDSVPLQDAEAEFDMRWAYKADPHEHAPEYHTNACIVDVQKALISSTVRNLGLGNRRTCSRATVWSAESKFFWEVGLPQV